MKVVAFNGSVHPQGNTYHSLKTVGETLQQHGIEMEIVQVGGKAIRGCVDCGHCKKVQDRKCGLTTDEMNDFISKAIEADGILVGSPVYFGSLTPETKALIDRLGRVARGNGFLLRHKPGAAVVVNRRAGGVLTYSEINLLFGINSMFIVGSSYWNLTVAGAAGEWENDAEGIGCFRELGENMAWFLQNIHK